MFEDMGSRRLSIMDEESNAAQKSEALRAASFQLLRIGCPGAWGHSAVSRCCFGMLQVVLEGCCFGVQLL